METCLQNLGWRLNFVARPVLHPTITVLRTTKEVNGTLENSPHPLSKKTLNRCLLELLSVMSTWTTTPVQNFIAI